MGEVVFLRPDGRHVGFQPCVVPPLVGWREADSRLGLDLAPDAGLCLWGGEKLDLGLAVDCLLGLDGTAA